MELRDIAFDIKYHYIKARQRAQRGFGELDSLPIEAFEKAAALCQKLQANPNEFVAAQFHNKSPELMNIPMLTNSKAEEKYKDYMETYYVRPENLFDVNVVKLKRQIQLGRPVEWILNNKQLEFPAWFRICITKEPDKELIAKFKAQAKEEMTPTLRVFLIGKKLDVGRIDK